MSAGDAEPLEDQFASHLAAWDEALAHGDFPPDFEPTLVPPELHERLGRGVACLALLEQMWGGHTDQIGRFRIQRELGSGNFGTVFLAWDVDLGRPLALKIPRPGVLVNQALRQRFQQEAQAAARLDHPNIVPIYETSARDGACYIAAAYCPGMSLAAWLERNAKPVAGQEAAALLLTIAEGVHHAHSRGVLHRDLKPANILLVSTSAHDSQLAVIEHAALSTLEPRITDFGLAKLVEEGQSGQTATETILGTPSYMSPEQAEGKTKAVTTAADIYALGAILYELLTGQPPFQADSALGVLQKVRAEEPVPPRHLQSGIAREVETICLKCLEKQPRRRYATAHELAEDLRRFLAHEPILARPVGAPERLLRWCQRNPALASAWGFAAILTVALIAGAFVAAVWFAKERALALANLSRAQAADRALEEELGRSYLDQARAKRNSGRGGRRFESLERIDRATRIFESLETLEDQKETLRNDVIASLAFADLGIQKKWGISDGDPFAAAFDRGMERYAVANRAGIISVRRWSDNTELLRLQGPGKTSALIQFSLDSRLLFAVLFKGSLSTNSEVWVWNLDTRKVMFRVPVAVPYVAADFAPDSRTIAVGDASGGIRVYDVARGNEVKHLPGGIVPYRLAFHPAGKALAVCSLENNAAELRSMDTGEIIAHLPEKNAVRGIAWRPDGKRLACACANCLSVWDVTTGMRLQARAGHEGATVDVAYSGDGRFLASGGWDGFVRLWDAETGRQLANSPGHLQYHLQFGPEDRLLGAALVDGSALGVWEVAAQRELRVLDGAGGSSTAAQGLCFSPDGRILATATTDGVRLWDWRISQSIARLPTGESSWVSFSPNGTALFVAGGRGLQRVAIATNADVQRFGRPKVIWAGEALARACLSSDGQLLAASTRNSQALAWDFGQAKRNVLNGHPGACFLSVSADKRWLGTGAFHGTGVKLWDAATAECVKALPVTQSANLAFSPDGHILVTSTASDFSLWDVGTWRPRQKIPRPADQAIPGFMAFSPDGQLLAVTLTRTMVQLVDPATGRALANLESPGNHEVGWVCFHPDGTKLAVACGSDQVEIWDLRLIRDQLAPRGLDWNLPAYPGPVTSEKSGDLKIEVSIAE